MCEWAYVYVYVCKYIYIYVYLFIYMYICMYYVDSIVPMIQSKQDYQVVGLPKVSCKAEM